MLSSRHARSVLRSFGIFVLFSAVGMSAGSSESALNSPQVEPVAARDAWRMAEVFTAGGPECDVVVGSGDSMLPLYPDQTVLLIRRLPIDSTNVFQKRADY